MKIEEKHMCGAVLALIMAMVLAIPLTRITEPSAKEPREAAVNLSSPPEQPADQEAAPEEAAAETVPEETEEYTGERPAWISSFRKLNVRQAPDTESEVLGFFEYRQEITVTGADENGFYLAVGTDSYSGEEISGYCYGEYLTFEEPGEPQVQLDIAAYYQTDSQWAEEKIGSTKKTIGAIGCTTTCMAMSESYLTQTEILPNEMEDQLWYDENGDMGWPDTYTWTTDEPHYLEVIFGKLHEGIPVLVGAERHNGRPHWVLVTGYQGDASEFTEEDFIINDPLTSYRTTLQQFFDEYPEFYKIAYYTG